MASKTLSNLNDRWPDGTSVGAFARDAFGNATGAAVDTQAVSSGAVTFTGLTAGGKYVASASGKTVAFMADPAATGGSGIPPTTVNAKGDLIVGTADDTVDRLAVGANDTVPTGDSGAASGISYQPNVGIPGYTGVVMPAFNLFDVTGNAAGATNNQMRAVRVIVPKKGTLVDLYVWVGTSSGNILGSVYDVGATSSTVRTKLWDGGSLAMAGSNLWFKLGDPNLSVNRGDHLDFSAQIDNVTGTLGRPANPGLSMQLPTSFMTIGGCLPKLAWSFAQGALSAPATVSEANATVLASNMPLIIARIS